jgi:hypothetical protein
MADTEHVNGGQDQEGSDTETDDVSKQLAALAAQVQKLTDDVTKRDELIQRTQSAKDKLAGQLEKEQERRKRVEAARVRDLGKIPENEQTSYLRNVAAQEHQRATRFELAHQYGLDPTELEGEFATPEAMRLHAVELAQARGQKSVEEQVAQLTTLVTQLTELQTKQAGDPETLLVQPDVGGRRASSPPATQEVLEKFDAVIAQARGERDSKTAIRAALAKAHRDASAIMRKEQGLPEELPPELKARLRR